MTMRRRLVAFSILLLATVAGIGGQAGAAELAQLIQQLPGQAPSAPTPATPPAAASPPAAELRGWGISRRLPGMWEARVKNSAGIGGTLRWTFTPVFGSTTLANWRVYWDNGQRVNNLADIDNLLLRGVELGGKLNGGELKLRFNPEFTAATGSIEAYPIGLHADLELRRLATRVDRVEVLDADRALDWQALSTPASSNMRGNFPRVMVRLHGADLPTFDEDVIDVRGPDGRVGYDNHAEKHPAERGRMLDLRFVLTPGLPERGYALMLNGAPFTLDIAFRNRLGPALRFVDDKGQTLQKVGPGAVFRVAVELEKPTDARRLVANLTPSAGSSTPVDLRSTDGIRFETERLALAPPGATAESLGGAKTRTAAALAERVFSGDWTVAYSSIGNPSRAGEGTAEIGRDGETGRLTLSSPADAAGTWQLIEAIWTETVSQLRFGAGGETAPAGAARVPVAASAVLLVASAERLKPASLVLEKLDQLAKGWTMRASLTRQDDGRLTGAWTREDARAMLGTDVLGNMTWSRGPALANVPIAVVDDETNEPGSPVLRIRSPSGPVEQTLLSITRDQPFDIDLILPDADLPKDANGKVDRSALPQAQTVTLVLPNNRGQGDLRLRYSDGNRWSTASPLTVAKGGGGSVTVACFEFIAILESPRLAGGVGGMSLCDGDYLSVRYKNAETDVRVHNDEVHQAIASYRDGLVLTQQTMLDRLQHGGYSSTEIAAMNDPTMPSEVKAYLLKHAPTAEDLEIMRRRLAYANHGLALIGREDLFQLARTRMVIASTYADLVRYPTARDEIANATRPGTDLGYGFRFTNQVEEEAFKRAIEEAKEQKTLAMLRGARDSSMGFYRWTAAESGAGDWVMLAGIDPETNKKADTRQRLEAAANITHGHVTEKLRDVAIARLEDAGGTTGGGQRTDTDPNAPPAPSATGAPPAARPPTSMPPVPDRPGPLPGARPAAEPPAIFTSPPAAPRPLSALPDAPQPAAGREVAQPPAAMPPPAGAPRPLPGREFAQPPGVIPPPPGAPRPMPAGEPALPRPTIEYPADRRPAIDPSPRPPATPGSEDLTRPLPPVDPKRAETATLRQPALDPARAAREARAELETDRGPAGGQGRRQTLDELRRTTGQDALRHWDETEAVIDRMIEADPRLRQIDRERLSTYVGVHAARRDTTPTQLAAEALNYHGGGITPGRLVDVTGVTPEQAARALRRGWEAMQVSDVDVDNPPPVRRGGSASSQPSSSPPPPPLAAAAPSAAAVTPRLPDIGARARVVLERLAPPSLDRAAAEAYLAAHASRPGISEAQLVAEAMRRQGLMVTGKQLAVAADLPSQLAGNEALRQAARHLSLNPRTQAAVELAANGSNDPAVVDIASRWRQANDRLEERRIAVRQEQQRELRERIAQAPPLPARPANAPPATARTPQRYLVEGDTEYLQRIMSAVPLVPTQVHVDAAKVNRLIDSMMTGRTVPPGLYEPPLRLNGLNVEDGHNRLVAAVVVSQLTGRPLFESWGPNAILPNPGAPLPLGVREQRGTGWNLRVNP